MTWHPGLSKLRDTLANLYPLVQDAQRVAHDAFVQAEHVNFQGSALNFWHSLLQEASKGQKVEAVITVAQSEYPESTALAEAVEVYRKQESVLPRRTSEALSRPTVPIEKRGDLRPPRFTGRDAEVDWILEHLRDGRSVTISASGGMGKTALAVETLARLAPGDSPPDRYPDGIIFHEFYREPRTDQFAAHLLAAYGVEFSGDPVPIARNVLAYKRALIVLDGAEDAEDLNAVLSLVGNSTLLMTMRPRSQSRGETLDLTPFKPSAAHTLLKQLGGKRARPTAALKRICELVGYLPLAINLAGAYLAHRGIDASEYVDMLEASGLSALDLGNHRQDSIPILLEKSIAQVSEQARRALSVVGLLAYAPFDRQQIAAALDIEPHAATAVLGELVDYGLLLRPKQEYKVGHALVHEYACTRLTPPDGSVDALATYYRKLVESESAHGAAGFARLAPIRPHVMALLRRGQDLAAWHAVGELAAAVVDYFDLQGYLIDRLGASLAGLASARALQHRHDEGDWLGNLGLAYRALGRIEEAIQHYEQALAIHREIGDRRGEGHHLGNLGLAYRKLGRMDEAREVWQEALRIFEEIKSPNADAERVRDLLAEVDTP